MNVVCVQSIQSVRPDDWQRLRGSEQPLLCFAWLDALEQSASVGAAAGWLPLHLLVRDGDALLGALPLYLKGHSFGEFVYDWAWADLAGRIGEAYYPKLVSTSPLTPAEGARLLVRRDLDPATMRTVRRLLLEGARSLARELKASGVHLLFADPEDRETAVEEGFFVRTAWQYHWRNNGYTCFDDFLGRFDSKRRREIRRERRVLREQGYRVVARTGHELKADDVADLYRYYASTCRAYRTQAYLRRGFFERIIETKPEVVVAFFATDPDGQRIAGTFNIVGDGCLWGRYWGADRQVPLLHFETCLYAMIEYAIAAGIERIEPGAGGEHKYTRGFEPTLTSSAHWLSEPRLHGLLEHFTEQERGRVDTIVAELDERGPLRRPA